MAEIIGNISTNSLQSTIDPQESNLKGSLSENKPITSKIKDGIEKIESLSQSNGLRANLNTSNNSLNTNFDGVPSKGYGHVYFLYADDFPEDDADTTLAPTPNTKYMGVLSSNQAEQPMNYNLYTWIRIRGEDGAQGEQGEQGEKGDSGETSLTIVNTLLFTGFLNVENWVSDSQSKDSKFYYQKIDITDIQLVGNDKSKIELIEYMNIHMNDKVTPLVELLVSANSVELGLQQIEQWNNITRAYVTKEEYIDENDMDQVSYYLIFECYRNIPNIQLPYQVKVI